MKPLLVLAAILAAAYGLRALLRQHSTPERLPNVEPEPEDWDGWDTYRYVTQGMV